RVEVELQAQRRRRGPEASCRGRARDRRTDLARVVERDVAALRPAGARRDAQRALARERDAGCRPEPPVRVGQERGEPGVGRRELLEPGYGVAVHARDPGVAQTPTEQLADRAQPLPPGPDRLLEV